jgi:hypothetical protein
MVHLSGKNIFSPIMSKTSLESLGSNLILKYTNFLVFFVTIGHFTVDPNTVLDPKTDHYFDPIMFVFDL